MTTLSLVKNRTCQLEPWDLYPKRDMTQTEHDLSARDNVLRHLPHILSERILDIGNCDKVFASMWLTEDVFLIGTKSNQASGDQQYLATGGANPNEIAVYKLPEITPYVLGQSHKDWIFDVTWIADNIVITGSRDLTMAAWKIPDLSTVEIENNNLLPSPLNFPLAELTPSMNMLFTFSNQTPRFSHGGRIRSLAYNKNMMTMGSLQASVCDASLHFWDINIFQEVCSVEMPYCSENVCLELQPDLNLYAVGSRAHVSFIDGRIANHSVGSVRSKDRDCGVRSLQFKNDIVSIGSGGGNIYFYDLRAAQYLPSQAKQNELCALKTSYGWVRKDATYRDFFSNLPHPPNAIYTHQYSPSNSRMLLAGGPLPLGLYGNYCSIWS